MKNVFIVSKENNALAMSEAGIVGTKRETTGFLAVMKLVNEILEQISTDVVPETVRFYVPDLVQAIASGSAVDYVKTGRLSSKRDANTGEVTPGRELSTEEVAEFAKFYALYSQRILNVIFGRHLLIGAKSPQELINLKKNAWEELDKVIIQASTVPQVTVVDPDKALREGYEQMMLEAIKAGDKDMHDFIEAKRNALRPVETITTQVSTGLNKPKVTTQFEEAANIFANSMATAANTMIAANNTTTQQTQPPIDFSDSSTMSWSE